MSEGEAFCELVLHLNRKQLSGKQEILDLQSIEMGGDSHLPLPQKHLSKIMKILTPQVYHAQARYGPSSLTSIGMSPFLRGHAWARQPKIENNPTFLPTNVNRFCRASPARPASTKPLTMQFVVQ